jgi:hypothetical protein
MRFDSIHGLSMQWRRRLANPRRGDVSLLCVLLNSTLESLPLQLCSHPLSSNSFTINRLGNLFPFLVLLLSSLPLFFWR